MSWNSRSSSERRLQLLMTFVAIWSKALLFSDSPFCRIRTFWYSDTPPPISSHKRNPLSQTCGRDDLVGRIRLQIVSTLRSCAVRSPSIALIRIWVSRFSIPLQSSRQEVVIRIGGWVCNRPDKANTRRRYRCELCHLPPPLGRGLRRASGRTSARTNPGSGNG